MGATKKQLTTVSYVTDTDVGYYSIGEVDGSFNEYELQQFIKGYGHEQLCAHLAFLQFQVWEAVRKINSEQISECKVCNNV